MERWPIYAKSWTMEGLFRDISLLTYIILGNPQSIFWYTFPSSPQPLFNVSTNLHTLTRRQRTDLPVMPLTESKHWLL